MNQNKMRKSQMVMLSALGVMAFIVVALVGVGRMAVSSMDSARTDQARPIDYSNRTEKIFDIKDFDSIRLNGTWKVKLEQGDDWRVELDYPKDMEQELMVSVENGRLILDPGQWGAPRWDWKWWNGGQHKGYSARIVMPRLESVEISGATNLDFYGFNGKRLDIIISGAGNLDGERGRYEDLSLTMSGAGNVDLRDMLFTDARINLSGAGNVNLGMDGGTLSGNLSGFGNIEYYGSVKDERVNISGFGKVHRHRK
jgi:hypothetical protein